MPGGMDLQTETLLNKYLMPMISGGGGDEATGQAIGGTAGGLLGDVIGGPAGGAIGKTAGSLLGSLVGSGFAKRKKKKAEGMMPAEEDPEMRTYLNDVSRQKRSFKIGSAFSESLKELKDQQVLTQRGILSASGGASGAAVTGLGRTQKAMGDAFGKIAEKGLEEGNFLDQLYGKTLENMSERKLGIQTAKYNQAMADATENKKKGGANSMAQSQFLQEPGQGTAQKPTGGGGGFNLPSLDSSPTPGTEGDGGLIDLTTMG